MTNEGNTRLMDRICPEYLRQKKIKEIMAFHNISFYEAARAVPVDYLQKPSTGFQAFASPVNFPTISTPEFNNPMLNRYNHAIQKGVKFTAVVNRKATGNCGGKRPFTEAHREVLMSPDGRASSPVIPITKRYREAQTGESSGMRGNSSMDTDYPPLMNDVKQAYVCTPEQFSEIFGKIAQSNPCLIKKLIKSFVDVDNGTNEEET